MTHLIDSHRYRDMQFNTMADSVITPVGIYEEPPPVAGHYSIITAREIPLRDGKSTPVSVRAFEIQGPLLPDILTNLRQLALVWSMSLAGLSEMQIQMLGHMRRGRPRPPLTVFELSQTATPGFSPWYWAVSIPRGDPLPLDSTDNIPGMYVEDFTEYPNVYAAFDGLMHRVRERWSREQPWTPRAVSVLP